MAWVDSANGKHVAVNDFVRLYTSDTPAIREEAIGVGDIQHPVSLSINAIVPLFNPCYLIILNNSRQNWM